MQLLRWAPAGAACCNLAMRGEVIGGRRFVAGAATGLLIACANQAAPADDASASAAATGAAATSEATTGETGTSGGTSEACPVDVDALTTGKHTTVETTGCSAIDCAPAVILGPDCPATWSGGNIVGDTELGCFHGTKALFAYTGCGGPSYLTLYVFDASVSDEVATSDGGFRLRVLTGSNFSEGWLGEFLGAGTFDPDATIGDGGDIGIWMVVDEAAGHWGDFDPNDPPRLRGWLKSEVLGLELYGTFDAAYCGLLNRDFCPD